MVQNRNLPIVKRIKTSSKQSLGIIGLGLGIRFGKYNGKNVVDDDFGVNKLPTVSTRSSTRDCTQSLTRQKSESNSSYSLDELEALGVFERHHKADEAEVRLVVGVPMPHSSERMMSFQQETLDNSAQPSNLSLNVEQEPKVLLIRTKSDLTNSEWIQKFIFSIRRGGEQEIDEALVKSILSKASNSNFSIPSINKILIKLADAIESNDKLLRLLAELEKPFSCTPGMEGFLPGDMLRLPEAEGFTPSTNSLSPYQERAKTHVLSAQTKNDLVFVAKDGTVGVLKDKSTNHLLSKHGDSLDIDDPLPPNPNQKSKQYNQIRTRINKKNKQQFAGTLEKILQNPTTEVFPDVSIRGIKGQVYYTEDYGGFFIGIHTEGEFAGQIMKAQPISERQLKILRKFNKID